MVGQSSVSARKRGWGDGKEAGWLLDYLRCLTHVKDSLLLEQLEALES